MGNQFHWPIFFRVVQESYDVNVVDQVNPDVAGNTRESGFSGELFFHHRQQQISDQGTPYLDADGILVVPQKVLQREVLFELFEKQFYLPALFVNQGNLFRF